MPQCPDPSLVIVWKLATLVSSVRTTSTSVCETFVKTTPHVRILKVATGTGYRGVNCGIDIDECQARICRKTADVRTSSSFQCDCSNTGYNGTSCENDINECSLLPAVCQHSSTCINSIGNFSCICGSTGYHGRYCQADIDDV
eukprot:gene10491-19203_t